MQRSSILNLDMNKNSKFKKKLLKNKLKKKFVNFNFDDIFLHLYIVYTEYIPSIAANLVECFF